MGRGRYCIILIQRLKQDKPKKYLWALIILFELVWTRTRPVWKVSSLEGTKFIKKLFETCFMTVVENWFAGQVCIVTSSNFKLNLDWKVQSWSLSHILSLILKFQVRLDYQDWT